MRVHKPNLLSEPLCIFAKLKSAPDRALVTFAVFSAIALILFPSDGWSQQDGQPAVQRHVRAREQAAAPAGADATSSAPAAQGAQAAGQRWHARAREKPATPPTAEADPTSSTAQGQGAQTGAQHLPSGRPKEQSESATLDPSSSLAQALTLCDKNAADQETFALPGLKGAVTLDRCYKGRGHLLCVFGAFIAEAKSLTDSYTKIADAKYPEFNTVANICQIKSATLAADIAGSEDFNRRFAGLKSKYESASKCAANVKQSFRDVVLSDMAQPPEILKSMSESIEGDITRVSDTENQIVGLATKMEAANKAMATIEKIHRAMCVKEKDDAISSAANADQAAH